MLKRLSDIHIEKPLVLDANLFDHKLSDENKKRLRDALGTIGYGFDSFTSYAITDKEKEGKPANFAVIPNQYFYYAFKMYEFATELYKYSDLYEKLKYASARLVGNKDHIFSEINNDPELSSLFERTEDINLFSEFLDKDNSEFRSGAKRFINDTGVARGARDCFASIILKEINLPDASSSIFGRLVFDLCSKPWLYAEIVESYTGNSNSDPKSCVLISSSKIRDFINKVFIYLFQHKIEDVIFGNLVDATSSDNVIYKELVLNGKKIYRLFRESDSELNESDLTSGTNIRFFPESFLKSGSFYYLTNQWADIDSNSQTSRDINTFSYIFNALYTDLKIQKVDGVYQLILFSENISIALSKPFLLLAGISGTGKSRFVRKQAEAQGSEQEFYQLVPVRPDWHEPSDLLGYVSRIGGSPRFVVTDALRFIVKAWKATAAQNILLSNGKIGWTGKTLDEIKTYWLCLDEMNLAPVEQYFADYLSVIESRHWLHAEELETTGKDYVYCCQPIVSASSLNAVNETNRVELASDLGLDIQNNPDDFKLWASFLQHGIPVPFNLVVAGTVNMDETTHGFSRKVIDRALTFDFGRFFPNDFQQLWSPETHPKTLQFSRMSHASPDAFVDCEADTDGAKTIHFLQTVNTVLRDTPFELAYRALNELLLAVVCHKPQTEPELQAVWDDFLMCKVLPRIEGDDEKLTANTDASNISETVLDALIKTLSVALAQIWDSARPDLLRENINNDEPVLVPCRSKAKLEWMKNRLERNSFTSFWP